MSLSGNLGFVSLDEVLRLLTRSGQRGAVAVSGDGIEGRVFVTKAGISLATTTDDDGLRTLLTKSGHLDVDKLNSGGPLVSRDDNELVELLREVTVESVYRLGLKGDSFEVYEDQDTRYASPKPFELEHLLEDAKKRLDDWAEVSEVVPNLSSQISFQRDLGEREEVKIRRDAWRVLSEVGSGTSVTRIAAELGTTEFWTARVVARLLEDDLVESELENVPETPAEDYEASAWDDGGVFEEPASAEAYEETVPAPTPDDESREDEPVAEDTPQFEEPDIPAEAPVADSEVDEAVDPDESWWKEPEAEAGEKAGEEAGEEVEEDTEAFLEKVFSELETPEEEEEEEGYGLLRRRRLGAMRDLGNDS